MYGPLPVGYAHAALRDLPFRLGETVKTGIAGCGATPSTIYRCGSEVAGAVCGGGVSLSQVNRLSFRCAAYDALAN